MKTTGERIKQAREAKGWSAHLLALSVGYKTQSGISNLENRATGTGGNRIVAIANRLRVPVDWLLNGPDSDVVPFLPEKQEVLELQAASRKLAVDSIRDDQLLRLPEKLEDQDPWIAAGLQILRELDPGQRQAMVAKMREFKQFLGPPRDGQALSMAS